jgi:hypothetical protein
MGAALWAKYFVVVLAAPMALFLLIDRDARRALATPGPWLALAVAAAVMAPHLSWLVRSDFLPFAYASHRAAPVRGWYDHLIHPAVFAAGQVFFLLPSFFIAAALVWPRATEPMPPQPDAFDHRIVAWLAFGPGIAMIALTALSGRGTFAMWGYPLWLFVGLWIVLAARTAIDDARLARVVAAWAAVFAVFVGVFVVNYSVLPYLDHRYRAVFYPGDRLAAALAQRFRAATGEPLRYVIGSMWDGGNVAHYAAEQPRVLIDGDPARAPWIDLADLRSKGAVVVWTGGDTVHMPAAFAEIAKGAEIGAPFTLAPRRGDAQLHVGWAILRPR